MKGKKIMKVKIMKKRNCTAFKNFTIEKFSAYKKQGITNVGIAKILGVTLTELLQWMGNNHLYVYQRCDKNIFRKVYGKSFEGTISINEHTC